jgi:DNA (cytosine-5)-methyltransferase 1
LWKRGYEVAGFDRNEKEIPDDLPILDASLFGVPQRRRRFILAAWLPGEVEREFEWPQHTHGATPNRKKKKLVTVEDALGDLDFLSAGFECHRHIKAAESDYAIERRNGCLQIFNHLATKHRKSTVNMYRRLVPGETIRSIPEEYRTGKQTMLRLSPTTVSKAVLALPDDLVHYRRLRIPTVREMARLQSFDDDYVFLGKRTTSDLGRRVDVPQYTQVGNAVPPLLAKALGSAVMRCLGGDECDVRDTDKRRERHEWLRGSSGFLGYTLSEDARGNILFLDLRERQKRLPFMENDEPLPTGTSPIEWVSRPQRRLLRASS